MGNVRRAEYTGTNGNLATIICAQTIDVYMHRSTRKKLSKFEHLNGTKFAYVFET